MINSFPGYKYENGQNIFFEEDVGRGGLVWAIPGIYHRVYTFDVRSMHPSSIIAMQYFGEYTHIYEDMITARAAIKHKDYDSARKLMNGMLAPFLEDIDDSTAKALSNALKIALNSCYGLTSAKFPNVMKHKDNVNNIVALRGALFMATLRDEVLKRNGKPFHIKTDSIKIENPSEDLKQFIFDFCKQYGYEFEIEHIFEKICLVNNAVYIAKLAQDDPEDPGKWTATGAQFQHPYIFKSIFSHEQIIFEDLCETKEVKNPWNMYLDMNEDLGEDEHNYQFVGRVGLFCPINSGFGAGVLVKTKGEKYDAVSGTKGYRWLEAEIAKELGLESEIDMSYFRKLVDDAIEQISKFGDAEAFISDDVVSQEHPLEVLPWCNKEDCNSCDIMQTCHDTALDYMAKVGDIDDKV